MNKNRVVTQGPPVHKGIYHKLTRYHLDGKLKMDNNLAENAIRHIAPGRKNWLFC